MSGPVIRQSNGSGVGAVGATTYPQALLSAVLAGSRLMAYVVWGASTGTVTGVSDTINGSTGWVPVPNSLASESTGPTSGQWWTRPNSAAGPAPTITATYSVSQQFRAVIAQEITGSDPSDIILASAKSIGTATTSMVSNSITTLVANCLIIGACSNDTNSTVPTAGTGYVIDKTTTNQVIATEQKTLAAAGATTAAFTFGTAAAGVIQIIALKPALPRPAISLIRGAPEADFFGSATLLKSLLLGSAPPPPVILPVPRLVMVRNLDADPFAGSVLSLKGPSVPIAVTLSLPRITIVPQLLGDAFGGSVLLLKGLSVVLRPPPIVVVPQPLEDLSSGAALYLKSPLFAPVVVTLNRPGITIVSQLGDDTFAGAILGLKAPFVAPVVVASLPVPAVLMFLNTAGDAFPGSVLMLRALAPFVPHVPSVFLFLNTAGDPFPGGVILLKKAIPRVTFLSLDGGLIPSGTLTKQANIGLTGGMTPAGGVHNQTNKGLSGNLTPSGTLITIKTILKSLSGTLQPVGDLVAVKIVSVGEWMKERRRRWGKHSGDWDRS